MDSKMCPKRGRMVIWCEACQQWFGTNEGTFHWECPKCGSDTKVMKCTRCGHRWKPRTFGTKVPTVCAGCRSPYFDRLRMRNGDEE